MDFQKVSILPGHKGLEFLWGWGSISRWVGVLGKDVFHGGDTDIYWTIPSKLSITSFDHNFLGYSLFSLCASCHSTLWGWLKWSWNLVCFMLGNQVGVYVSSFPALTMHQPWKNRCQGKITRNWQKIMVSPINWAY